MSVTKTCKHTGMFFTNLWKPRRKSRLQPPENYIERYCEQLAFLFASSSHTENKRKAIDLFRDEL